jgi:hypothetical protein
MSKSNNTCDDCGEPTKLDEWSCNCKCIDCGPCKDKKCKSDMKDK